MGEVPPCALVVGPRRAAAAPPHSFRLARRHGRRKVHVVRLGGGGCGAARAPARRGFRLRRWLRRAVWRLAELCVAALTSSGHPGAPSPGAHPPWNGVEPLFAAPFVPFARMKHTGAQA